MHFFLYQLLRECKEVINGASLVKDYYVSMVDGILRPGDSDYDSLENSIEDYEEDLREILKVGKVLIIPDSSPCS